MAQGRRRAFFWGARNGVEQLPAFPEPMHKVKNFNTGFAISARECVVDFLVGAGAEGAGDGGSEVRGGFPGGWGPLWEGACELVGMGVPGVLGAEYLCTFAA